MIDFWIQEWWATQFSSVPKADTRARVQPQKQRDAVQKKRGGNSVCAGMLITCTVVTVLCFVSSAPATLPLVQEAIAEFSFCKKSIETLRNDMITLENAISTMANCSDKNYSIDRTESVPHAKRLERSLQSSESSAVNSTKLDPSNKNHSMATTTSSFNDGLAESVNLDDTDSMNHALLYPVHQNTSVINDLFKVLQV
jgi:hypothetical protein